MSAVFIVGCGRSGTTSMLRALELSSYTHCELEPFPNLNHESRDLMDGRLADAYAPIVEHVVPRVVAGLKRNRVYVEKQISLVPFMEHLARLLNCKFIIMKRDGRDVVSSLVNWHNKVFPIIYQECLEEADLSERAKDILAKQTAADPFDYSLPRPHKGDPLYEKWPALSRFEMVTWYWKKVNRLVLEQMEKLNRERYLVVDYTNPQVRDLKAVYDFAGLDDFDEAAIAALLDRKVNSLKDRTGAVPTFPKYRGWSPLQKRRFLEIACDISRTLGYPVPPHRLSAKDAAGEAVRSELPESAPVAQLQTRDYAPYKVEPSGLCLEQVLQNTNAGCYSFSEAGTDLTNDLPYFEDVVSAIQDMENIRPGGMEELALGNHGVNLAIRADVDMDIAAALEMACIAEKQRFPVSFYLTHTAAYYGSFVEGTFRRNECNASLYLALQDSGCEVGLHTDPYGVYLEQGADGAAAIRAELAWLREIGLNIRGTSAHNAAPLYGVENFEIFQGRTIRSEKFLLRNYRFLPLGVLNERELGLSYEAGKAVPAGAGASAEKREAYLKAFPECDFIRDDHWFRTYILDNPYCSWGYSYNIWVIGRDSWVISGTKADGTKLFQFKVGWDAVAEFLQELRENETCMMVVHPIYMSWRERAGAWPKGSQSAFAASNRTCVLA